MMNANREIMLMLASNWCSTKNAPMKEMGIPSATQKARPIRKNNARLMKTSMMPCAPLRRSRLIRSLIRTEKSPQTAMCSPGGSSFRNSFT